jgi:predicted CoA-substrate-specific enzyme activase
VETNFLKIGIDAGSTTLKLVVLNASDEIIYKSYRRHKANVQQMFRNELQAVSKMFSDAKFQVTVTGSAGMGIAEQFGIPFVQEVIAAVDLTKKIYPQACTLLDIGGEDAKMVFFSENRHPDIRMNGNCAGGTGAFIDQMASLLHIPVEQLGKEAELYEKIYPVASRCGVFAKTDIQNLISQKMSMPDIAASTLHAVALQTLTSLARGSDIVAPILCTGGPLTFIPALREQFRQILNLQSNDLIIPENSEYFPALGAAFYAKEQVQTFKKEHLLQKQTTQPIELKNTLPVLFENEQQYSDWKESRNIKKMSFVPLGTQKQINAFLGIDSGSTTTKITIIDENQNVVFSYYANNEGDSLKKTIEGLNDFYRQAKELDVDVNILSSAVTGYGEDLIRSALGIDCGIVETIAHLAGAQYIDPEVSFILDIGGQDMKSMFVNDGVISNIELNEACSSGCGSFLQNFASTMHLTLDEFSQKACLAKHPSDLGSRCTVFMNSKVKQSLRENAEIGDIAAGLAYSVVKNCLFKVLKISNLNVLGDHIVVQGGTFRNDAVFRAFELLSEKTIGVTDYPELMGAFGAALYASKQWKITNKTTFFSGENALKTAVAETSQLHCKGCTNQCAIVRLKFPNGNSCYAGNKCEKIYFGKEKSEQKGINTFETKNEILFNQLIVNRKSKIVNPKIGIPRILNMFDDFPFWKNLFSDCGYDVILSPESNVELFQKGVGTVMSDNICFPAKLVHGHILTLLEQNVDRLFYPLIPKAEQEFPHASNSYNCPIVSGYPDVIRSAIDPENKHGIPFDTPVISFNNEKALKKTCWNYFSELGVKKSVFNEAFQKALSVRNDVKSLLINSQKEILQQSIDEKSLVFIVAGRPYHADPLIHQKIGQILSDLGVNVLTDDVFRDDFDETGYRNLNIISQWSYPNRMVQTALQVAKLPENVQMIQLNSFGCGPDSFFMDEVSEVLKKSGKNLTVIRIDEIASPSSIRLRLRSLVESLKIASKQTAGADVSLVRTSTSVPTNNIYEGYSATFEKEDQQKTILVPWFADFISPFVPVLGKLVGYNVENLPPSDHFSAEIGLKYGHNEVCYPSTLVLGDIIKTLQSGQYDLNNTAISITQTGGQCRATNYIAQIKNGLKRAGFEHIPVIALTTGESFQSKQKGFQIPWHKLAFMSVKAMLFGDALYQMYTAVSVREKTKGDAQNLFDFYMKYACDLVSQRKSDQLLRLLKQAVADFNMIPTYDKNFTKIGLVGEIYVKYNDYAQAHISQWLREKNMEVITPPVQDFIMQYFVNSKVQDAYGIENMSFMGKMLHPVLLKYMNRRIHATEKVLKDFRFFTPSESIFQKAECAKEILNLSNQFGEGWLIAGEVATYARQGISKVVCIQPFGCIANHVVAKGIEKRLKKFYPEIDLLYLDVDSGIAEVNLQNRLHFLMK